MGCNSIRPGDKVLGSSLVPRPTVVTGGTSKSKTGIQYLLSRLFLKYVEQIVGRFKAKTKIDDIFIGEAEWNDEDIINMLEITMGRGEGKHLFTFTLDISDGASFCTGADGEKYEDIMDTIVLSPYKP